jgi:hypothetical protein
MIHAKSGRLMSLQSFSRSVADAASIIHSNDPIGGFELIFQAEKKSPPKSAKFGR